MARRPAPKCFNFKTRGLTVCKSEERDCTRSRYEQRNTKQRPNGRPRFTDHKHALLFLNLEQLLARTLHRQSAVRSETLRRVPTKKRIVATTTRGSFPDTHTVVLLEVFCRASRACKCCVGCCFPPFYHELPLPRFPELAANSK